MVGEGRGRSGRVVKAQCVPSFIGCLGGGWGGRSGKLFSRGGLNH